MSEILIPIIRLTLALETSVTEGWVMTKRNVCARAMNSITLLFLSQNRSRDVKKKKQSVLQVF